VRHQNSGVVEDFILPYSAVYLRNQKWKNYWNRSTFVKVIVKIKVARFYGPRCILCFTAYGNETEEFICVQKPQRTGQTFIACFQVWNKFARTRLYGVEGRIRYRQVTRVATCAPAVQQT